MTIFIAVVTIGLLILIHEIGHFAAARALRLPVRTFSVGFGRAMWAIRRGGTEFRLGWVPLGGYVLLDRLEESAAYFELPLHKRVLFALGGPAANVLLMVPLFALFNVVSGSAGGTWSALLVQPWAQTADLMTRFVGLLPSVLSSSDGLSGVLGIVTIGSTLAGQGLASAVFFAILLSANLAILNLLPLPPLDGGRIVFDLLQRGWPRAERGFVPVVATGWLLILGLFGYATVLDVGRLLA